MPYRPKQRRTPRYGGWSGYGAYHRRSYAARRTLSRLPARRSASRGPSFLLAGILILIVAGVTVASAGVIAAGGVATVTIASLDQGLPDVQAFQDLSFSQPTRILDRTGKVELARFWDQRREVVQFKDIPTIVLDATTAVEDDTFWTNPGFDLVATVNAFAQDVGGNSSRGGASTITQQLVRARLLPQSVLDAENTKQGLYIRKAKELIQAYKLTQAFPGEAGKKAIITAYLNEIFYGEAYGIAAAAQVYFGKKLNQLTPAEAALLAGIPQNPVGYDLFKFAKKQKYGKKNAKGKRKTRLVIPTCGSNPAPNCTNPEIIDRRNFILRRLVEGKGRWNTLTEAQYQAALDEPVILKRPQSREFQAPQFVFSLLPELQEILGDREPITRGGYTVITTLDMRAQRIGEKVIKAGAYVPNLRGAKYNRAIAQLHLRKDRGWISRLRGDGIYNGALVAMDYKTGDILAYVGSAGYYRKKTKKFDPKYDHAGQGRRQPGSSWKPIVYTTGIDTGALTAGSVVLDITTPFAPNWQPKDADRLERGPLLAREALMYSLNIPAIRVLDRTGIKTVRKRANKAGFTFLNGPKMLDTAGLAGAIGTVEVHPLDMVAAYGAFGNDGKVTQPRHILKVLDANGKVIYKAGEPITKQVWSPQAAYIMSDILAGNTNPAKNTIWGPRFQLHNGPGGAYREAALKTGTTNDLLDFSTYGLLPKPKKKKQPAIALGVWFGNSDHSPPSVPSYAPIYSSDNAGEAWHAFMRDYMKGKPVATFERPSGVVRATIDKYTGGAPGPWTKATTTELFISGTQPGGKNEIDPPGLMYSRGCGAFYVQPARAENAGAPASWIAADNAWARRGGLGTSRWGTRGAYFSMAGKNSFGGPVAPGTGCNGISNASGSNNNKKGGGSNNGGGNGGNNNGGGNNGGSNEPAPTCKPGSTTKPPGCTIPAPTN